MILNMSYLIKDGEVKHYGYKNIFLTHFLNFILELYFNII
jgi:hypothetical protein